MKPQIIRAVCLGTAVLLLAPAVWAGPCVFVLGGGSANSPDGFNFQGTLELAINGRPRTVDIQLAVLGIKDQEEDGTQHLVTTTDWQIRGAGLKFTSFDESSFEPTDTPGVVDAVLHAKVATGVGRFNCGELMLSGELIDDQNAPEILVVGKLCKCKQ